MDFDEYPWRPFWPTPDPRFKIYFELANRIAYLNRLARERPDHALHILRWLDRYLPAAIYMHRLSKFEASSDELLAVWPRASAVADQDSLPDISMHILQSSRGGKDFSHPADRALVDILKKADCSPCRYRGYRSIVGKRLESDYGRYIYDAIARNIACGLLGSHARSGVRAEFPVRFAVYEWYIFSGSNRAELLDWIEANQMLLTYCLREHVFAVSESLAAYEKYVTSRRRWHSMRRNACTGMDEVRTALNIQIRPRELITRIVRCGLSLCVDLPEELVNPLNDYNERNLQISSRPMTDSICEKMRKAFGTIDKEWGVLKSSNEEEQDAIEWIEHVVAAFEPEKSYPYERLHRDFNVSYEAVRELSDAEEVFLREIDRTRIKRALCNIRKRNERDYKLLSAYFDALGHVVGLVFRDLPYCVTERQIRTLRILYGVAPGEELPEVAGTFFACPNCTFLKARVENDASRRGKGVRTPIYDALSGKIYCQKAVSKIRSSTAKKTTEDNRCRRTELIRVNMIGRIAWSREQKASVFMCPGCCQLCTHSRNCFLGGEIGCENCMAKPKKISYPCNYCETTRESPQWLLVADDTEASIRLRFVPFCGKHYPRWTTRAPRIQTLSEIREMLHQHAFTIALHDEDGLEIDRMPVTRGTTYADPLFVSQNFSDKLA